MKFSKKLKWTPFSVHFKGFQLSCKTAMLHNSFSLKHLLMASYIFWTYCGQSFPGLFTFVYGSKMQDIKKECSENFIEYFTHSKNGITKCVRTQNIFSIILNSKMFSDKKIKAHSKQFIKIIGVLKFVQVFKLSKVAGLLHYLFRWPFSHHRISYPVTESIPKLQLCRNSNTKLLCVLHLISHIYTIQ